MGGIQVESCQDYINHMRLINRITLVITSITCDLYTAFKRFGYSLAILPNSLLQMIFINILYVLNYLLHCTSYSVHYLSNLFTTVFQSNVSLYSKLFYHTYAFKLFYRSTSSRSFLKIIFMFQMSYKIYLCFYIINCMPLYVQLYKKCLKDLGRLSTLFPFRALRCGLVGYRVPVRRSFKYQLYIMCTHKVIKGPSNSSYALG